MKLQVEKNGIGERNQVAWIFVHPCTHFQCQVRAAAAQKMKEFCLALDPTIREQTIMNHLLPSVKVRGTNESQTCLQKLKTSNFYRM